METADHPSGLPTSTFRIHEWSESTGWYRFYDGKKRLCRRGRHYLVSVTEQESEDMAVLLLEEVILH